MAWALPFYKGADDLLGSSGPNMSHASRVGWVQEKGAKRKEPSLVLEQRERCPRRAAKQVPKVWGETQPVRAVTPWLVAAGGTGQS